MSVSKLTIRLTSLFLVINCSKFEDHNTGQMIERFPFEIFMIAGADLGNYGWGGRIGVNKGKALDRGTKCRVGGGYGRGVSPLPIWKKIEIRHCLDVF